MAKFVSPMEITLGMVSPWLFILLAFCVPAVGQSERLDLSEVPAGVSIAEITGLRTLSIYPRKLGESVRESNPHRVEHDLRVELNGNAYNAQERTITFDVEMLPLSDQQRAMAQSAVANYYGEADVNHVSIATLKCVSLQIEIEAAGIAQVVFKGEYSPGGHQGRFRVSNVRINNENLHEVLSRAPEQASVVIEPRYEFQISNADHAWKAVSTSLVDKLLFETLGKSRREAYYVGEDFRQALTEHIKDYEAGSVPAGRNESDKSLFRFICEGKPLDLPTIRINDLAGKSSSDVVLLGQFQRLEFSPSHIRDVVNHWSEDGGMAASLTNTWKELRALCDISSSDAAFFKNVQSKFFRSTPSLVNVSLLGAYDGSGSPSVCDNVTWDRLSDDQRWAFHNFRLNVLRDETVSEDVLERIAFALAGNAHDKVVPADSLVLYKVSAAELASTLVKNVVDISRLRYERRSQRIHMPLVGSDTAMSIADLLKEVRYAKQMAQDAKESAAKSQKRLDDIDEFFNRHFSTEGGYFTINDRLRLPEGIQAASEHGLFVFDYDSDGRLELSNNGKDSNIRSRDYRQDEGVIHALVEPPN